MFYFGFFLTRLKRQAILKQKVGKNTRCQMDFDQISEQVFGAGSEELSSDSLESLQKFLQSLIPSDLSEQNSAGNFRDFLPRILDDWVATDAAPSKLSAQFLVLEWIHQLMSGDEFHDFLKQNSGQRKFQGIL